MKESRAVHWVRFFIVVIVTASMAFMAAGYHAYQQLPEEFTVVKGEQLSLAQSCLTVRPVQTQQAAQASAAQNGGSYQAQVCLFHIPVKTVTVKETAPVTVVPGGTPFGMKLFTNGVMVVGLSEISTAQGNCSPAEEAGLALGDIITEINGSAVTATEQISEAIEASRGNAVTMTVQRQGATRTVSVVPVQSDYDGGYKGGLWVRDSTAGIGIVTYYCPETGTFGGLGHGICDVDTNDLMPLRTGEIVPVCISGIVKGQAGDAGALQGYFTDNEAMGKLVRNDETGVYGTLHGAPAAAEPISIAMKQDVQKGSAQILTTIEGETPALYDIEIQTVNLRENADTKNMVVHITDPELLEKTGGIVQGMSGSPIIQNGKLVGAVTHVFINDPQRGYAIFIENMLDAAV